MTPERQASLDQVLWLRGRLTDPSLDHGVLLTFSRQGSWMGLRVLEGFQLSGDGRFMWEWEDAYRRIPYQHHTRALDRQVTATLFRLFEAGLPSLRAFHAAHPSPALLPDAVPSSLSIQVGDQRARYFYPLDTRHHASVRFPGEPPPEQSLAPELKRLIDELVRLRTESRSA